MIHYNSAMTVIAQDDHVTAGAWATYVLISQANILIFSLKKSYVLLSPFI